MILQGAKEELECPLCSDYHKKTAKADTERMAVTMGKEYVIEKTKELMNAASCCAEAKAAAQAWLDAVGTDGEAAAAKAYVAELEEDIMPVDGLIAFAKSEAGAQVFGAEMAKNVAAHGEEIKAAGGKYCDCPACAAVAAILEKKDEIL